MEHIFINVDEALFVPKVNLSLFEMVTKGGFHWPNGASCVTQECDGELLWWSADLEEVKTARKEAFLDTGLMPLVGLGSQVHADYYLDNGREVVAKDWESAVVSVEQFKGAELCSNV
ncbi:TPA: hypothetical protein P7K80_001949 [Vibrio cholerae]|uniref:hypothetical protein n=1 Tax=Vibrio cholerae TaxID=666 RepID=UPI0012EC7B37|nr:hypothetical protein [Vibrio cholerae]MVE45266.1 hypothetical protein [Vibrio cholerae]HAS4026659.1 hypothetical protein [Vibrio cholerae]HAS4056713.1 hypothetical protein [Vibrio cholerae]HAS4153557.1 hypothetical protein [Vibrio cholerae]